MNTQTFQQLGLLTAETLVIGALLLWFFRLRDRFGLALLYVTLGGFQNLQSSLASNLSIELSPGFFISPGSTIMFSAMMFTLLVVYIREDASETRSLVYGIVIANFTIGLMIWALTLHLGLSSTMVNENFDPQLLISSQRVFFAGTAVLVLDVVLLIVTYEFYSRLFPQWSYIRVFLTLATVLSFDTIAFGIAAFYPTENFSQFVVSGILGKLFATSVLAMLLSAYLRMFDKPEDHAGPLGDQMRGIIGILTYRQRYAALRERFSRDSMTGLFNRGFFDANLQKEISRAARLHHSASLMMVDLDHFKQINDNYGHTTGDRVIILLADATRECFRASDLPCRFGGEEFAIVMPDTDKKAAQMIAARLKRAFETVCTAAQPPLEIEPVTMTIGIATFPEDGNDRIALLERADKRLYMGKRKGRDCIVAQDIVA